MGVLLVTQNMPYQIFFLFTFKNTPQSWTHTYILHIYSDKHVIWQLQTDGSGKQDINKAFYMKSNMSEHKPCNVTHYSGNESQNTTQGRNVSNST